MLRMGVCKETRAGKQRVLPVLRFNRIHAGKEPLLPLNCKRLTKEIELPALHFLKTLQHHTG